MTLEHLDKIDQREITSVGDLSDKHENARRSAVESELKAKLQREFAEHASTLAMKVTEQDEWIQYLSKEVSRLGPMAAEAERAIRERDPPLVSALESRDFSGGVLPEHALSRDSPSISPRPVTLQSHEPPPCSADARGCSGRRTDCRGSARGRAQPLPNRAASGGVVRLARHHRQAHES
jgi:hypothetical protein